MITARLAIASANRRPAKSRKRVRAANNALIDSWPPSTDRPSVADIERRGWGVGGRPQATVWAEAFGARRDAPSPTASSRTRSTSRHPLAAAAYDASLIQTAVAAGERRSLGRVIAYARARDRRARRAFGRAFLRGWHRRATVGAIASTATAARSWHRREAWSGRRHRGSAGRRHGANFGTWRSRLHDGTLPHRHRSAEGEARADKRRRNLRRKSGVLEHLSGRRRRAIETVMGSRKALEILKTAIRQALAWADIRAIARSARYTR